MTLCEILALLATIFAVASLVLARMWRSAAQAASIAAVAAVAPSQPGSRPQLSREIARARRYQRPLTVVAIKLEGTEHHAPGPAGFKASSAALPEREYRLALAIAGRIMRDSLREGDWLSYNAAHDHYVIALPETDRERAVQFAKRLHALLSERLGLSLRAGVTEFPGDGVTTEELLSGAVAGRTLEASAIAFSKIEKPIDGRPLTTTEAA
jgi:hypothetical protein